MGKNNNKEFIIGSVIGGLIGAATALFLAPKSGKEIRDNIGNQANAMRDRTGKLTNEAIERGSELASVAKQKTASLSQVVTEQSSQIMNKVKDITSTNNDHSPFIEREVANALAEISDEREISNKPSEERDDSVSDILSDAIESSEDQSTDDLSASPKGEEENTERTTSQ